MTTILVLCCEFVPSYSEWASGGVLYHPRLVTVVNFALYVTLLLENSATPCTKPSCSHAIWQP